jgi:hypothetical protein
MSSRQGRPLRTSELSGRSWVHHAQLSLRATLLRGRLRVRSAVAQHPALFFPVLRGRSARRRVKPGTDIVIEGYPRSGNSFALSAFKLAQSQPVEVAHHLHAPAQVIAAARRRIPTLVLIRHPDDAVISQLIRDPYLTPRQAFRDYTRFYRRLLPFRDSFVLARFDSVTEDFGSVTRAVNARFDTQFGEFQHTPENVERCFAAIEERNRANNQGEVVETGVTRPSEQRDQMKQRLRPQLDEASLHRLRAQARSVYEGLVMDADV